MDVKWIALAEPALGRLDIEHPCAQARVMGQLEDSDGFFPSTAGPPNSSSTPQLGIHWERGPFQASHDMMSKLLSVVPKFWNVWKVQ